MHRLEWMIFFAPRLRNDRHNRNETVKKNPSRQQQTKTKQPQNPRKTNNSKNKQNNYNNQQHTKETKTNQPALL